MPNMVDPYFAKSVIFICEDDVNGTMGVIVNKPISQMKIINAGIKNKIFEDIINESEKIFFGGPVRLNEACIVQKTTGKSDDFSEKIELSNDLDLIQEILFNEKTPKDTKLIFGHASWGKNQLQEEIKALGIFKVKVNDNIFPGLCFVFYLQFYYSEIKQVDGLNLVNSGFIILIFDLLIINL